MKNPNSYPGKLTSLKNRLVSFRLSPKAIFIFMGIASTAWFLVRVIPKPQRAGYPCMRAAAPIMSGFVIYLLTLGGAVLLFKKTFSRLKQGHYISALVAFAGCIVLAVIFTVNDSTNIFSSPREVAWTKGVLPDGANNPMGTGFGIYPGRVVWSWNTSATNENCTNVITDAYFMPKNNNQDTINSMADKSIKGLGGKSTVKDSWDAIFKNFNQKKTGSANSYVAGEKIFIKVNNGTAGWAIVSSTLAETGFDSKMTGVKNAAMSGTTPSTVLAFIRQLVDSCNVAQSDIYVAEPMTHVYKSMYDVIHAKYPNVKILDKEAKNTALGRTTSAGWTTFDAIIYSDKGKEMPDAISDEFMVEMYDADYMINIAALKAHARAGVTFGAKLHFGTHGVRGTSDWSSFHLHDGLICTVDNDYMASGVRKDYKMYRVLVDLMGHEKLGGNTLLFVVDGLWGGIEATDMPVKWGIAPFNNDFPNSLFISQDEIAIESVCLDFLRAEADKNIAFNNRPFFPAVDDYLHQGADKANWPTGIIYDPEDDGTEMPSSLGIHEHWNNITKKQYTRNIYSKGVGIDLFSIPSSLVSYDNLNPVSISGNTALKSEILAFPNPCTTEAEISYALKSKSSVEFKVIAMDGKIVYSQKPSGILEGKQTQRFNTENWNKGTYIVVLNSVSGNKSEVSTVRLVVK